MSIDKRSPELQAIINGIVTSTKAKDKVALNAWFDKLDELKLVRWQFYVVKDDLRKLIDLTEVHALLNGK